MKSTLSFLALLLFGYTFAQTDSTFSDFNEALKDPLAVKALYVCGSGTGSIPDGVAEMQNIEILCITGMNLTEFPKVIYELPNLKELYMGDNPGLNGLPEDFGKLSNLTVLSFAGSAPNTPCGYQGIGLTSFPKVLLECKALTEVDFTGSVLAGCTVDDLKAFVKALGRTVKIKFDSNTFPLKSTDKFMKKLAGTWTSKMVNGKCKTYSANVGLYAFKN